MRHILLPVVASLGLGLAGCGGQTPSSPVADGPTVPLPSALQSARIENDRGVLESRLRPMSQRLTVQLLPDVDGSDVAPIEKGERLLGVRLTLVGEVAAPVVDGRTVQANDVDIRGQRAVIAYNFAGDPFAGAVQVIDFSHPEHPEVESEVLFASAEATAVALQGSLLFVGLAAEDAALSTPAVMQEFEFTGSGLEASGGWLQLPSWAVTDLAVHGDDVLAGTGARDGGVTLVEHHSMRPLAFTPNEDVRGLAAAGLGAMCVSGGEANLLGLGMPLLDVVSRTSVQGYKQEGAKGTLEVMSSRCYLGAGDGGFQVRDAAGALLDELSGGDLDARDGRPAIVNAVSIANHLAFVAAGPAGVQVVHLGRYRCDGREAESPTGMRVLGELLLEDGASCNMVKSREDILVIAAGNGGVKLVHMEFIQGGDDR